MTIAEQSCIYRYLFNCYRLKIDFFTQFCVFPVKFCQTHILQLCPKLTVLCHIYYTWVQLSLVAIVEGHPAKIALVCWQNSHISRHSWPLPQTRKSSKLNLEVQTYSDTPSVFLSDLACLFLAFYWARCSLLLLWPFCVCCLSGGGYVFIHVS